MRYTRWLRTLGVAMGLALLLAPVVWSQANQVKNRFEPCAAGSPTPCDNKLSVDGTMQRKETVGGPSVALGLMTTGVVMLDGSNPTSVNMNPLATIDGCALTIQGSATPGSDPTTVTAVTTATAGQLDIYAWKPTAAGNTALTASSDNARVIHYVCGGS